MADDRAFGWPPAGLQHDQQRQHQQHQQHEHQHNHHAGNLGRGLNWGVDAEQARAMRTSRAAQLRRQTRNARTSAKRRKGAAAAAAVRPTTDEDADKRVARAQAALASLESAGGPTDASFAAATHELKLLLAEQLSAADHHSDPVVQLCAQRNLPARLVEALEATAQDPPSLPFSAPVVLDAVTCITHITSGSAEQTASTIFAAPHLVKLIACSHAAVAEQAAWAIGNMAGDSQEVRDQLKLLNVIQPLVALLGTAHFAAADIELKRTAAWAICNLSRGASSPAQPFFATGADKALLDILRHYATLEHPFADQGARELILEVAWCLSFFSAKEPDCCEALLRNQALELILPLFARLALQNSDPRQLDAPLITPLVRAVSNMLPILGPDRLHATLAAHIDFIAGLGRLLTRDVRQLHPTLCKESLWAVSNCCALGAGPDSRLDNHQQQGAQPDMHSPAVMLQPESNPVFVRLVETFLAPVCWHFTNSQVEFQREATYAIFNLASRPSPDTLIRILNTQEDFPVMEVMLDLLRGDDPELTRVSLDFCELVLTKLSNPFAAVRLGGKSGSQLVCALDGIDALEHVQYGPRSSPQLAEKAAALVNKFFGEDYLDEEEEEEAAADDFFPGEQSVTDQSFAADFAAADRIPPSAGRGRGLVLPAWLAKANDQTAVNARLLGQPPVPPGGQSGVQPATGPASAPGVTAAGNTNTSNERQTTMPDYFGESMQTST